MQRIWGAHEMHEERFGSATTILSTWFGIILVYRVALGCHGNKTGFPVMT